MEKSKFIEYAIAGLGSSFPGAGVLGVVLKDVIKTDLEIRRENWLKVLGEAFEDLENNGLLSLDELKDNNSFTDIFIAATKFALSTSVDRKRLAFKNAIINAATGNNFPDLSTASIYLQDMNVFTEWHFVVLKFISSPNNWFVKNSIYVNETNITSIRRVIFHGLPKLEDKHELLDLIWDDLIRRRYVERVDLRTNTSREAAMSKKTTNFGDGFLKFIESP